MTPPRDPAAMALRDRRGRDDRADRSAEQARHDLIARAFDDAYAALVHRVRQLGAGEDAEDAAQDAFVRAFENGPFHSDEHVRRWLHVVARNAAHDRGRRRHREVPDDDLLHLESSSDPARTVAARLHVQEVLANLAELSEADRNLILQIAIEGRSIAEIASTSGRSPGAVRVALHRARQRLLPGGKGTFGLLAIPGLATGKRWLGRLHLPAITNASGFAAAMGAALVIAVPAVPGVFQLFADASSDPALVVEAAPLLLAWHDLDDAHLARATATSGSRTAGEPSSAPPLDEVAASLRSGGGARVTYVDGDGGVRIVVTGTVADEHLRYEFLVAPEALPVDVCLHVDVDVEDGVSNECAALGPMDVAPA